jgi:hypothetical protein
VTGTVNSLEHFVHVRSFKKVHAPHSHFLHSRPPEQHLAAQWKVRTKRVSWLGSKLTVRPGIGFTLSQAYQCLLWPQQRAAEGGAGGWHFHEAENQSCERGGSEPKINVDDDSSQKRGNPRRCVWFTANLVTPCACHSVLDERRWDGEIRAVTLADYAMQHAQGVEIETTTERKQCPFIPGRTRTWLLGFALVCCCCCCRCSVPSASCVVSVLPCGCHFYGNPRPKAAHCGR